MFESTPFIRNLINRRTVDGGVAADARFVALVNEARTPDEQHEIGRSVSRRRRFMRNCA